MSDSCAIKRPILYAKLMDQDKLYRAYMPFIEQGGLFIATDNKHVQIGDGVDIQLELLGQGYLIQGRIIWLTPPMAQGGKPAGVGVQLQGEIGQAVRKIIEQELAGRLGSDKATYTL